MQLAGQHDKANQQLNLLNDVQRTVQNQRESVNSKMAAWSGSAAKASEQRERRVLLVNDCCDNVHGVTGHDSGSAYYKPA